MTIGVVTACSDAYAHHLPRWAEAVAALETAPAQVAIAAESDPGPLAVDYQLVLVEPPFGFARYYNAAIGAVSTDWVAWIGVDDAYRPTAFNGVERDDADVVAFGFEYDTGMRWLAAPSNDKVREMKGNEVPCGSPFRRTLWEREPLRDEFEPLADYGLWVGFAGLGARFAATGRVDVDYAYAGHRAPPEQPALARIAAYLSTF